MRWPDRRLIDRLGVAAPIIQAPMAGAGGPALAIAAIRGGGVGSLPCALIDADMVVAQAAQVRAAADGPLNLNFFCHQLGDPPDTREWQAVLAPYRAELNAPDTPDPPLRRPFDADACAAVERVRPEVVSFHFGLPGPDLLDRVRATGALVIASATTLAEGRHLAAQGCDAVIAQGWEAGGHAGHFLSNDMSSRMGLFALLPQMVDAVDVPVIAAGGIADARGIAAALLLGASAVQLGTAYLATPQSLISPTHRERLASPAAEATVFTNLFTGGMARGLRNRLIDEIGPVNPAAPRFPYASATLQPLRAVDPSAADFAPMWSGQAGGLARAIDAQTLTRSLADQTLSLLARTGAPS